MSASCTELKANPNGNGNENVRKRFNKQKNSNTRALKIFVDLVTFTAKRQSEIIKFCTFWGREPRPLIFRIAFGSKERPRNGQNIGNPVSRSFFAPKPHSKACYAGNALEVMCRHKTNNRLLNISLPFLKMGFLAAAPFLVKGLCTPLSGLAADVLRKSTVSTKSVRKGFYAAGKP